MRITRIRIYGKAICLFSAILLLLGMLCCGSARAEYTGYSAVSAEIPVSGTGSFVLKNSAGEQVASITLDGKEHAVGAFQVGPYDEPASPFVSYTISSADAHNKKTYDAEVYVTVTDADTLKTAVVIRDRETGEKKPTAYYPVMIDPPVKKLLKGNPSEKETFHILFEGVSVEGAAGLTKPPMPEGSDGLKKVLSIKGAGETEAGEIWLDRAGVYTYRFTEVDDRAANYTYDSTAYSVVATVTEGASGLELKTEIKKDGKTADAVVFENVYRAPISKVLGPKTGDQANPLFWGLVAVIALAAIILILLLLRKRKKTKKHS